MAIWIFFIIFSSVFYCRSSFFVVVCSGICLCCFFFVIIRILCIHRTNSKQTKNEHNIGYRLLLICVEDFNAIEKHLLPFLSLLSSMVSLLFFASFIPVVSAVCCQINAWQAIYISFSFLSNWMNNSKEGTMGRYSIDETYFQDFDFRFFCYYSWAEKSPKRISRSDFSIWALPTCSPYIVLLVPVE